MKNLKLDVILIKFVFFGDLITNEDLEETYRTLYFFESPWYVCYWKNNEKAPNPVCSDFFLQDFFFGQKILGPLCPPISASETCAAHLLPRCGRGAEERFHPGRAILVVLPDHVVVPWLAPADVGVVACHWRMRPDALDHAAGFAATFSIPRFMVLFFGLFL